MLNVNILSVVVLTVFTAECIKLNVVVLNAVRLTVVAGISKIILVRVRYHKS